MTSSTSVQSDSSTASTVVAISELGLHDSPNPLPSRIPLPSRTFLRLSPLAPPSEPIPASILTPLSGVSDIVPIHSPEIDSPSSSEEEADNFRDIIIPTLPDIPVITAPPNIMANRLADLSWMALIKPEEFSGEKLTVDIQDFLDTLEMSFPLLENQIADPVRLERAKVLTLQSHLIGKAKQFWVSLRASQKATYELAATALRTRFPVRDARTGLSQKSQAIAEMNSLKQGVSPCDDYAEKAGDLYAILGDDFSEELAIKFVDGIDDENIKGNIDALIDNYTFQAVVTAFDKCTKSRRRKEMAKITRQAEKKVMPTDVALESLKANQQMVNQVAELVKSFQAFRTSDPGANTTPRSYSNTASGAGSGERQGVGINPQHGGGDGATNPAANYPRGTWAPRPNDTFQCFRCGNFGHMGYDCTNPPLPRDEQARLRESRVARYPPRTDGLIPPAIQPAPAAARKVQPVSMVEHLSDEDLGLVGTDPKGDMLMSAHMVEVVQNTRPQSKGIRLSEHWKNLSQDNREYLIAMVEKRNIEETSHPEVAPTSKPRLNPRLNPGIGNRPRGTNQQDEDIVMSDDQDSDTQENSDPRAQPFIPDPFYNDPANQHQPQFMPSASLPKKRKTKTPKVPKAKYHIKMMKGVPIWDPVDSLRKLPVVGLDYGNLFDLAPSVRIAVGKAFQMDKPALPLPARGGKPAASMPVRALDVEPKFSAKISRPNNKLQGGVLAEPQGPVYNFHAVGKVWSGGYANGIPYEIGKILIDGGAVVNLMPQRVAKRLGLKLYVNDDIVIRTATDEVRPIHQCTYFNIEIGQVPASVKVYVIDIPQSYSLLLGRRWLYQVRAIGDYENQKYTIYDSLGTPRVISPSAEPNRVDKTPEVILNPDKKMPVTELTEREQEELSLGSKRMNAIINRLVVDAKAQEEAEYQVGDDSDEEE